jgi:hypothetical protein
MHRIVAVALCLVLAGCGSFSGAIIKADSLAFNGVVEDTTNKLLVLNVLRARDKAPLHFADIPVIRESMQQNATLGLFDVSGPVVGTTLRNSRTQGIGVQFSPSFEITSLHSKEFTTGMTTPIDAKIVKYWLDRGLDRRIVLLLFFSAAEIVEIQSENGPATTLRIMNSPREAADVVTRRKARFSANEDQKCDTQSDFERYLKLINSLQTFFAHSFRERRLLASGLNLDLEKDSRSLQSFVALDQNKTQLVYDKGTRAYNLYALSPEPRVAFCLADASSAPGAADYQMIGAGPAPMSDKQNCFRPVVEVPAEDSTRAPFVESPLAFPGAAAREPSRYCGVYNRFLGVPGAKQAGDYPKLALRLHIRSVGEIFQFLGDLLFYQDELKRRRDHSPQTGITMNTPITFGYCADAATPGCDDIFLRLDAGACNARFSLVYRDKAYHVANYDRDAEGACGEPDSTGRDHTLEILAVLHQLVGLHRSAADIRATPAVQVLP